MTTDTFEYTISDIQGGMMTATVSVGFTRPLVIGDSGFTDEATLLTANAAEGVLANDDPSVTAVTAFDAVTAMGAAVNIAPDGSYTYDPTVSAQLDALKLDEVVIDTFTYEVDGGAAMATVSIFVFGLSDDPDDQNATAADMPLVVDAASGVLSNDPSVNPTVTDFDSLSALGATVTVAADGSYTYDPTQAEAIKALAAGDEEFDRFTYTSTDGTTPTSAVVVIALTGVNDVPVAVDDQAAANTDTVLNGASLLANDIEVDRGETITISNYSDTSVEGATVVVLGDGSYTYDPSSSTSIASLTRGQFVEDIFGYEINDGSETAIGLVRIKVTGVQHPVTALPDEYQTSEDDPLMVDAASGLLSNDSDIDVLDTLTVIAFDATSTQGAGVQVFPDGSFAYDPSGSSLLDALKAGESVDDTFAYTVSDGQGSDVTATVTVAVQGVSDGPDDAFIAEPGVDLVVNAPGVLINDGLDAPFIIPGESDTSSRVFGVDVTFNADGSFTYNAAALDPKVLINFVNADGFAFDNFNYYVRSAVDGTSFFVTVQIAIYVAVPPPPPVVTDIGSALASGGVLNITTMDPGNFSGTIVVRIVAEPNDMFRVLADATVTATGAQFANGNTRDLGVYELGVDFTSIAFTGWDGADDFEMPQALAAPLTANTGGGNDRVVSGSGHDSITLGPGNDQGIGGPGNDLIQGGSGADVLEGGSGDDTLEGGAGNDMLNGGVGIDVLQGNGGADVYMDPSGNSDPALLIGPNRSEGDQFSLMGSSRSVPSSSLVVGLKSQKQTLGDLTAMVPEVNGDFVGLVASLSDDSTVLTINGPTLYGYTLTGNWSVSTLPGGGELFSNNGPLTMSSGLGDLTLPALVGGVFRVPTTPDPFDNVGQLDMDLGGSSALNIVDAIVGLLDNDAGSVADFFNDTLGINFQLPANLRFGLGLGAEIKAVTNPAPPLVDSLPYFFVQLAVGTNLFTFGGQSVSANNGFDVTIVFEPNDPYVFAKASVKGGGFVGAGGWSSQGYVPFQAAETPDVFVNAGGIDLFGNLYLEGKFNFGEFFPNYPISVEALTVLDLDANDDGMLAGNLGSNIGGILVGGNMSLLDTFGAALSDIAIGVNGKVNAEIGDDSVPVGLTVPLGQATAVWKDGIFGLRGATSQPFADTFLDFVQVSQTTIDGFFNTNTDEFGFEYQLSTPKFFGVSMGGMRQRFDITNANKIIQLQFFGIPVNIQTNPNNNVIGTFSSGIELPIIRAFAEVGGLVNFNTGRVDLTGDASLDLDFGPFNAEASFSVLISNFTKDGDLGLRFEADASASGRVDVGVCNATLGVSGGVGFTVSGSGFDISGRGKVKGSCGPVKVSVGFSFDNNGFTAKIPGPDIKVRWPGAGSNRRPTSTPLPTVDEVLAISSLPSPRPLPAQETPALVDLLHATLGLENLDNVDTNGELILGTNSIAADGVAFRDGHSEIRRHERVDLVLIAEADNLLNPTFDWLPNHFRQTNSFFRRG